ncbi:hypothetical protein LguiA_029481 [Lonicera macranthoides]
MASANLPAPGRSKNKHGKRPSRVLQDDNGIIVHGGWWNATTGKKDIYSEEGTKLGFKRTLKFYSFKNENKKRSEAIGTDWIMHEYSLEENDNEFQKRVICGIKYNGEKSKAVEMTFLAPNQDQDLTIQAGGGTKIYEEEEDLVRTQEDEELMANINELLYDEDQDLNPLPHLEVNSNSISSIEDDQNSSKVLASEKEILGNSNGQVVEWHKIEEFMMSDTYDTGFVNHGYHDLQALQEIQPHAINAIINEDTQVFENNDIQNWNSPVATGIEQNEEAVRRWEHDEWLSGVNAFVGYDQNLSNKPNIIRKPTVHLASGPPTPYGPKSSSLGPKISTNIKMQPNFSLESGQVFSIKVLKLGFKFRKKSFLKRRFDYDIADIVMTLLRTHMPHFGAQAALVLDTHIKGVRKRCLPFGSHLTMVDGIIWMLGYNNVLDPNTAPVLLESFSCQTKVLLREANGSAWYQLVELPGIWATGAWVHSDDIDLALIIETIINASSDASVGRKTKTHDKNYQHVEDQSAPMSMDSRVCSMFCTC